MRGAEKTHYVLLHRRVPVVVLYYTVPTLLGSIVQPALVVDQNGDTLLRKRKGNHSPILYTNILYTKLLPFLPFFLPFFLPSFLPLVLYLLGR